MTNAPQGQIDRIEVARQALRDNPVWYHTIELAPGIVTPGYIDLRRTAERLLPDDLSGRRALDVGTFDGFWAFEMERRGAEVVAIDVEGAADAEWSPVHRKNLEAQADAFGLQLGLGFRFASTALDSGVKRVITSVYDLAADAIGGEVDFAFSGAILVHLRDPVRALERIHDVLSPGGELRLMEPFSPRLTLRAPRRPIAHFGALQSGFNWWWPNAATVRAWARVAGFERLGRTAFLRPPAVKQMRNSYVTLTCRRGG